MKNRISLGITFSVLFATLFSFSACNDQTEESAQNVKGFAEYMYFMQLYTHKALLSIEAENAELADFYIHELEETTEDVIEFISEYGGFPISDLTKTMLLPLIEDLEDELETGNWEQIREKARIMVDSCNACHVATDHGEIVIPFELNGNPYLQDFSVR